METGIPYDTADGEIISKHDSVDCVVALFDSV